MFCCLTFLWLIITLVPAAKAQNLGVIAGTVVDAKNSPIPAVTVRLSSRLTGLSLETLTEIDGTFSFENLASGTYKIEASMAGFKTLVQEAVNPLDASSQLLSLSLQRPDLTEKPASPSTRSARFQGREQRPSARQGRRGRRKNEPGFREIELAGVPEITTFPSASGDIGADFFEEGDNSDLLLIMGNSTASFGSGDWRDPQFRRRMREMTGRMGFSMEGGNGSRGRGRGGPGGSNGPGFVGFGGRRGFRAGQSRINGSAFSNYRNSALNARPYSITGQEVPQPLEIQNNFGFSLGGPLPWGGSTSSGRGRFQQPGQWFFNYQGSRNREPYDVLTTVPTELERSGDFSQTSLRAGPLAGKSVTIYDPRAPTPVAFLGNQIPTARMNPASVELLQFIPLPNLPGSIQNYTQQRGLINTSDNYSARINTRLMSKLNVSLGYSYRSGDRVSSQIFPGLDTTRVNRAHNVRIGGIYRLRRRVILIYGFNFNLVRNVSTNPFAFEEDVAGNLGIEGVSREPINYGIPNITFTNYGNLRLGHPALNRFQTSSVSAGVRKFGTSHRLQIGGDIRWSRRDTRTDTDARGTFEFTGFASSAFRPDGQPLAGTGYDLADFFFGLPYATSRRFGSSDNNLRGKSFSLFIADDWRVRSNLTINLGLRYEYIQPLYEEFDRIVTLDVAPGFGAVEQVFPGQVGAFTGRFPRSLVYSDKNNLGPRIGIAWKPSPSSIWVFRAGYSLIYNPSVYTYIADQLINQPPFAVNQNLLTTMSAPLTIRNGFPLDPDVSILNSYAIDPAYRRGYVQLWDLSVQTQLFKLYALEVGYSGSKGTRLDILRAPNRAPSGVAPGQTEDNRTIEDAGNFVYQGSGANSILHSIEVRVNRRFSRGFRWQNTYTLAKSIDDASGVGGGNLVVVQDDQNIRAERSLSSFDQRHRFESGFNFELPFGDRRKFFYGTGPLVLKLISGWNITGSYQLISGTPLTARIGGNVSNNSGTGSNGSERPDSTSVSPSLPGSERTTTQYFNTAAFTIPPPGQFGNAGRYTIPGPGSNILNLSLRKNVRLDDDNRRLELRWQVTNVLNHPNYGGVGTVINALNYGRVTNARQMRSMEFQLRINF